MDVINIEVEVTGEQQAPYAEKSVAFDVKMFPASNARGLNDGLNLAGAPSYLSSCINGGALNVGVGLAAYLGRKRSGTE